MMIAEKIRLIRSNAFAYLRGSGSPNNRFFSDIGISPCLILRRLMFKVIGYVHHDDAFFEEQRAF
jgi:E3 ubiquitin-protein ligase DOA10